MASGKGPPEKGFVEEGKVPRGKEFVGVSGEGPLAKVAVRRVLRGVC